MWLLRRCMGEPKTILDIGCGDGALMEVLCQGKDWKVTGIDIYPQNVKKASKRLMYVKVLQGDLNKIAKELIFKRQKFDLVFCSQVIEHIDRKKGEELLLLVDKLAKKRIFMGTPRGFMHQPEMFLDGNPHQVHKSGWDENDFKKRGYRVKGIGFKPLWSEVGLVHTHKALYPIYLIISYILSPLVYIFLFLAAGMLCIKDIKNEKR